MMYFPAFPMFKVFERVPPLPDKRGGTFRLILIAIKTTLALFKLSSGFGFPPPPPHDSPEHCEDYHGSEYDTNTNNKWLTVLVVGCVGMISPPPSRHGWVIGIEWIRTTSLVVDIDAPEFELIDFFTVLCQL